MGLEIYKNIKKEDFLGTPTIIPIATGMQVLDIPKFKDIKSDPFLDGKYQIRYAEGSLIVYDGEKAIASFLRNKTGDSVNLVVDPNYRGQGIGSEMIYQYIVRFLPVTLKSVYRTAVVQKMCETAWNKIQGELK